MNDMWFWSSLCFPSIAPRPHQHSWLRTCARDADGLAVDDCACGARRRVRFEANGLPVVVDTAERPAGSIHNVLHDMSQFVTAFPPQAITGR